MGVQHSIQELHPELKFNPIPGYIGVNRSIVSENFFEMTYKNSLRKADEVQEKSIYKSWIYFNVIKTSNFEEIKKISIPRWSNEKIQINILFK